MSREKEKKKEEEGVKVSANNGQVNAWTKISFLSIPKVGEKQWTERERKNKLIAKFSVNNG